MSEQQDIPAILDAMSPEGDFVELGDELWWSPSAQKLLVNCNDHFYWASADAEPIEIGDIDLLRQAISDAQDVEMDNHALRLFAARKRGMRPQRLQDFPEAIRKLYEAAGPERTKEDEG